MPLIHPGDIIKVNKPLSQGFDIGTLVTDITHNQIKDKNITKARVDWIKEKDIGKAKDFFKLSDNNEDNVYHHVGIYSFRYDSLKKFVSLPQSPLEIELKLEQMRALEAKMTIGVTYVKDVPISVDTKEELKYVESIINN